MGHVGEVILIDQQEVAYEVEIENGGEVVSEGCYEQYQEYEEAGPSTSNANNEVYDYEYVAGNEERYVDEDGTEYIYEEATNTYQQILPEIDRVEEVEYVEEELVVEEGPSTSTAPSNVYVLKKGGKRKYPVEGEKEDELQHLAFMTTYADSLHGINGTVRRTKQIEVVKPENLEEVLANGQMMKKLHIEIASLKKENEKLKKEYETVHNRLNGLNMVHSDAKQRYKEANEEKTRLVKSMTRLKMTKKNLINDSCHLWEETQ